MTARVGPEPDDLAPRPAGGSQAVTSRLGNCSGVPATSSRIARAVASLSPPVGHPPLSRRHVFSFGGQRPG
jgi:hypothetical protein